MFKDLVGYYKFKYYFNSKNKEDREFDTDYNITEEENEVLNNSPGFILFIGNDNKRKVIGNFKNQINSPEIALFEFDLMIEKKIRSEKYLERLNDFVTKSDKKCILVDVPSLFSHIDIIKSFIS